MKILIAEDDANIRNGLEQLLSGEGYQVCTADSGNAAIELFAADAPDFVLLDIMMPGRSGYDVCREIRQKNTQVPVVFISAKSEEIDRVLGLELGADDYIMKPFGAREVVARIRAVARRCAPVNTKAENSSFVIAGLTVIPQQLRASRGDETIDLSPRDIKILQVFASNVGKVVSRDELFNAAWGRDYLPSSRTLDQHISKLRKRIETSGKPIIETVHGVGYRYDG